MANKRKVITGIKDFISGGRSVKLQKEVSKESAKVLLIAWCTSTIPLKKPTGKLSLSGQKHQHK